MSEPDNRPVNQPPHPAEWVVGILAGLWVAGLIIYLLVVSITETDRPAIFTTSVVETLRTESGWQVGVSIGNVGDKTAAAVVLRGSAASGEESEVTVDYVPAGSDRRATLIFEAEPRDLRLTVRGYAEP